MYNKPVAARPSIADWTEHLALPGKNGGWLATSVAELENKQRHSVQFAEWQVSRWASADLCGLSFHIHKTKLRKAIPPWSAPHPQYHQGSIRSGVGYVAFPHTAPLFHEWMQAYVVHSALAARHSNGITACLFSWASAMAK